MFLHELAFLKFNVHISYQKCIAIMYSETVHIRVGPLQESCQLRNSNESSAVHSRDENVVGPVS
jgi:hypothetical protein